MARKRRPKTRVRARAKARAKAARSEGKRSSRPTTSAVKTKARGKAGKSNKSRPKKGRPNAGKKVAKEYKDIGRDLGSASQIANKYLDLDPLSQIDASRPGETQDMLNNFSALADPTSAAYAGRRTGEMRDFMGRLRASTQGYDSRELDALREQRSQQMARDFQSGRASLMRGQSSGQNATSRSAQLLDLTKAHNQATTTAANDLFVQGADEKQKRLETYGQAVQDVGQQEFDRGQLARETYAQSLRDAQQDTFEKQKVNLGQEAASKAIQTGGVMGMLGIGESRKAAKQQNKLVRDLNAQRGSGGGGGGGNAAIAELLNQRADELQGRNQPEEEEEAA